MGDMPGPAPKPADQRRRTNAPAANTLQLPIEGRTGDAPTWPLAGATGLERDLWVELWATPQAVAWERNRWTRVVARYVQVLLMAEAPADGMYSAALLGECRQLEDRLGLTPMAMMRLRWEVTGDDLAPRRDQVKKLRIVVEE